MLPNNNNKINPPPKPYNEIMWSNDSSPYTDMLKAIQGCLHPSQIEEHELEEHEEEEPEVEEHEEEEPEVEEHEEEELEIEEHVIEKCSKISWKKGTDLALQLVRAPTFESDDGKQKRSLTLNLALLHNKLQENSQNSDSADNNNSEPENPKASYSKVLKKQR